MAALRHDEASLLSLTGAAGAAIVHKGTALRVGQCPPTSEVLGPGRLAGQPARRQEMYCTDHLAADWSPAACLTDVASGLLAVSISQLHHSYLMWFRPEVVRTVRWGATRARPMRPAWPCRRATRSRRGRRPCSSAACRGVMPTAMPRTKCAPPLSTSCCARPRKWRS